jgi:DNA gyrase subunit A
MQQQEARIPVSIEDEMRQSYLDYAMSVIVGRALPDVRDGLKPVHRRVLYAMDEMGLAHNRPYKKAARLVGDVMGKYHPHGDAAIYDTIVRMAQGFSMRYPLVDGQGNFGSVDGDPPAAMRYTEVRMAGIDQDMLADLDKETVDFGPNYDETLHEPLVLPTRIPNLLVNGSSGIAVGMATNIPPHNMGEVADALLMLLDNPGTPVDKLMECIQGPDFPGGAFIYGRKGIQEAYRTGRGRIQLRARAATEKEKGNGRERIIISEIPYQVNKARLVENIAQLVRDKKITGISEIRDESDREGMRVVLELKRDQIAQPILNQLYKHTQMQTTFGIIFLALVNNQPRVLTLPQMLRHFLDHRREVVIRRTRYEHRQAMERAHILEGLKVAIENIDRVIALIRGAESPARASEELQEQFELSREQAKAILEMRLQRLTALERDKILEELSQLREKIRELEAILASEEKVREVIREEILEVREKYADPRLTEIIDETEEIAFEDMIIEEEMVVTVSQTDYIKRTPLSLYRSQRRGGKGVTGMETKKEDFVEHLFVASTHHYILFFTDMGKVHWLKVHELPQTSRAAKGKAIVNLLSLEPGETVTAMIPVRQFAENRFLIMATRKGVLKKTKLSAYSNPRASGIIAIKLDQDDDLISVRMCDGNQQLFLATRGGQALRCNEKDVRPLGRTSRGVTGIKLREGDSVVSMEVVTQGTSILTVTEKGYGKRTKVEEYRLQSRGGKGIINLKVSDKNGPAVGVRQVHEDDEVLIVTKEGKMLRTQVKQISLIGRSTMGVRIIDLDEGDHVVSVARLEEKKGDREEVVPED